MKKSSSAHVVKKHAGRVLFILIFAFLLFLLPAENIYFQSVPDSGVKKSGPINLPDPPPVPQNRTGTPPPELSADGIMIVDIPSQVVLYRKNEHQRFLPASTTKIVTALVARDHYKLDEVLTVRTVIREGSHMDLISGEQMTFENLLYGTLVQSANDAAYTLAENYPGGIAGFVNEMNRKAASLNLENTHFTNPIGFDDPLHYTTPGDLAKIAQTALMDKTLAKIVGTRTITVSDINYTYFHPLTNVNELLGKVAGVSGVKTGFTQNAGEILVSEVKKNGRSILIVLLKSQNRFTETEELINWVFSNFQWVKIGETIPTTGYQPPAHTPQSRYLLQIHI